MEESVDLHGFLPGTKRDTSICVDDKRRTMSTYLVDIGQAMALDLSRPARIASSILLSGRRKCLGQLVDLILHRWRGQHED